MSGWLGKYIHPIGCHYCRGCFPWNATLNYVSRDLHATGSLTKIESIHLNQCDGKWLDKITLFLFKTNKSLEWGFNLCQFHHISTEPGMWLPKHQRLKTVHVCIIIIQVSIENYMVISPHTTTQLQKIDRLLTKKWLVYLFNGICTPYGLSNIEIWFICKNYIFSIFHHIFSLEFHFLFAYSHLFAHSYILLFSISIKYK